MQSSSSRSPEAIRRDIANAENGLIRADGDCDPRTYEHWYNEKTRLEGELAAAKQGEAQE